MMCLIPTHAIISPDDTNNWCVGTDHTTAKPNSLIHHRVPAQRGKMAKLHNRQLADRDPNTLSVKFSNASSPNYYD
ncbi:hypothetical protein E2C01_018116 [Portunus trituberculatus]|uniref:Uncharacterized protein n=1 Tax=Portunus trituberculatus TaxID=210409 RepID=A0A5B7DU85_PORTR|nr:hypothetical protein [Portunus trituberculatus]